MCTWNYAYWAARKGDWEQFARDRARFQKRLQDVGKIVSKVLDEGHRQNIYYRNCILSANIQVEMLKNEIE